MFISTPSTPDEFAGRRVLVTGGSKGIGAAVARRLRDAGATVVASARTPSQDAHEAVTFIRGDVSTEAGAHDLVRQAVDSLGGLDILINAAGASRVRLGGPVAIPDSEWQDALDVNFLSAVRVIGAALPALSASGPGASIVNVSTGVAKVPSAPLLHYGAAKAALVLYTKGMAKVLAPTGIRINLVTPGPVETPGGTEVLQTIADGMGIPLSAMAAGVPLGRFGDARDIAEAVAFLVSNRAQWITGADLDVNGGQ